MPCSLSANTLFLFLLLPSLGLLSGCSSFASRAKEKAPLFSVLDASTQARLEARHIQIGDTADMVYIALGRPNETLEKTTASGTAEIWIYSAYWEEYQGTRLVGYRPDVAYDPGTKKYQVSYRPDYQPIYTPHVEDRLRVTFEPGHVTIVEKAQTDSRTTGGDIH